MKKKFKVLGWWHDADCGHKVFIRFKFDRHEPSRAYGEAKCTECGQWFSTWAEHRPPPTTVKAPIDNPPNSK